MAQAGYTPIQLYYSTTASAAPSSGNLANGELAINITDGKLYYKDNGGTVRVLAGTGGTGVVAGSNTQVQFNNNGVFGASSGLTWDGTNLTASNFNTPGNVTLSTNASQVTTTYSGVTTTRLFTDANGGVLAVDGNNTISLRTGGVSGTTRALITPTGVSIQTSVNNDPLTVNGVARFIDGSDTRKGSIRFASGSFQVTSDATELNLSAPYSYVAINTGSAGTAFTRLIVTANGTVGVGTINPSQPLQLDNPTDAYFRMRTQTGTKVGFDIGQTSSGNGIIDVRDANPLLFYTTDAERMRIHAAGGVSVNGTNSHNVLTVNVGGAGEGVTIGSGSSVFSTWYISNPGVNNDTYFGAISNNNLYLYTANTARVRVRNDGYVQFGSDLTSHASPSYVNVVAPAGSTCGYAFSDNTTNQRGRLYWNSGVYLVNVDNSPLVLGTSGVERLAITSTGDVGINKSSPSAKLDVNGNITTSGDSSPTGVGLSFGQSSTNGYCWIQSFNSQPLRINPLGNQVLFNGGANIGINNTNPQNLLHIVSPNGIGLRTSYDTATDARFSLVQHGGFSVYSGATNNDCNIQMIGGNGNILFLTTTTVGGTPSERARITSGGAFFLGKSASSATVTGWELGTNGGSMTFTQTNNEWFAWNNYNGSGTVQMDFRWNNTEVGAINMTSSGVSYTSISDARVKKNIADADDSGAIIDALRVRQYDMIADDRHVRFGLVYQEAAEVFPEGGHMPEGKMGTLDKSEYVPLLLKEIQSLRQRVAQLEKGV